MALFSDGPPSTVEDLAALDSQLLKIANVEGIDITQKLALAHQELGLELAAQLKRSDHREEWLWISGPPRLNSIVVTPALKLWHSYKSLELVYRDSYNSQLNDRYAGKRDQFHQMATWAYEQLALIGIGVAQTPVPKAAGFSVISTVPPSGVTIPDGAYYVAMAWVNAAGEEGLSSDPSAVTTSGTTFVVSPGTAPREVTGWNVFAGTDPSALRLQNTAPIGVGQVWLQQSPVDASGRPPGSGQNPTYERTLPPLIQRG